MMDVRSTGIILAVSIAAAATGALAQSQQQGTSALKGHNSNAPVDVTADRIEVQDRADRAIFAGNVHATQAEMTLDTERLTVAFDGIEVFSRGAPTGDVPDLAGAVCRIDLDLGLGDGSAGYLASDLTYDYVRINAEYTT